MSTLEAESRSTTGFALDLELIQTFGQHETMLGAHTMADAGISEKDCD